jgi:glycosyltransferase involved in cell wall biosynthesis
VIGDYYYYQHENIYYLGPIDYEELPKYGNCFDVCIMAWKAAEWINNSNPCKTLEYLALGKPIVANSIPELVKNYSEFIYFADNPADFVKCAKRAVDEDNQTLQQRRKKIAALNDWDYKYNDLIKMLNKE